MDDSELWAQASFDDRQRELKALRDAVATATARADKAAQEAKTDIAQLTYALSTLEDKFSAEKARADKAEGDRVALYRALFPAAEHDGVDACHISNAALIEQAGVLRRLAELHGERADKAEAALEATAQENIALTFQHRLQANLIESLRADMRGLEQQRNKAEAALSELHRIIGRGEGHGSVEATRDCAVSGVMSLRQSVAESDAECAKATADANQSWNRAYRAVERAALWKRAAKRYHKVFATLHEDSGVDGNAYLAFLDGKGPDPLHVECVAEAEAARATIEDLGDTIEALKAMQDPERLPIEEVRVRAYLEARGKGAAT